MNTDLVSIIVPVYNTEKYLPKCIDSLIGQSYPNIEIILVNDGSTDNSLKICCENAIGCQYIRVINQNNMGVSAARNRGLLEARGKFLTFVDSDDILCPDAVETMVNIMNEFSADIVSAEMVGEDTDSFNNDFCTQIVTGEQAVRLALQEVSFSVCARLYRRESIRGISFVEGRHINEDGYFIFECFLRQLRLVETDKVVYVYTKREGSSSRVTFSDKFLDMLYFLELKKEKIMCTYPQFREDLRILEVRTNLNLLQLLCNTHEKKYQKLIKKCCVYVRKTRITNVSDFRKYEQRLYWVVNFRLYWLYKHLLNMKKRN